MKTITIKISDKKVVPFPDWQKFNWTHRNMILLQLMELDLSSNELTDLYFSELAAFSWISSLLSVKPEVNNRITFESKNLKSTQECGQNEYNYYPYEIISVTRKASKYFSIYWSKIILWLFVIIEKLLSETKVVNWKIEMRESSSYQSLHYWKWWIFN